MKIYFDANFSPYVADAMNSMCKGHFPDIQVFSTVKISELGNDASDADIYRYIGNRDGILITQDPDFRHEKIITDLCRNYPVGVFLLKLSRGEYNHWGIIQVLVNHWEEILTHAKDLDKPYWCRVGRNGVHKIFAKK